MQNRVKVVCIGHTTTDNLIKYDGTCRFESTGGAGVYAASGASYWGSDHDVGLVTRLGSSYNQSCIEHIRGHRAINDAGMVPMDKKGIHLWLLYDADGYRHWVIHHDSCSREEATPVPSEIPEGYKEARGFHFSPLPLYPLAELINTLPEDAWIQVDPHYEWFFPEYREEWERILRRVSVVLPSEDEFTKFFDIPLAFDIDNYKKYMRELSAMGPPIVVLKMGPQGAILYLKDEDVFYSIPSCAEHVVDVTGAGDSFCGSLLYNYVSGDDIITAAIKGMVGSSITLENSSADENFHVAEGVAMERFRQVEASVREKIKIL